MDGAQISGEISEGMERMIESHDFFEDFRKPADAGREPQEVVILDDRIDREYLAYVTSLYCKNQDALKLDLPMVYTPLNGAGRIPVETLARERGYTNFHLVAEQADPDPEFTTVGYPNPEDPKAFFYAEKLGQELGAAVLIATDPDADRMAIEIPDGQGGYRFLNGNQTGALLIHYLASCRLTQEGMRGEAGAKRPYAMIKSIVTSDFGAAICRAYGIRVYESLTGFKNICGQIPELERKGISYFFGYEESIGCAPGDLVRDKDGVAAAMLVAEMAAYYADQGKSLGQVLENLYQTYGYFIDHPVSIVLKGQEGAARIRRMMAYFRERRFEGFGSLTLAQVIDYREGYGDIPPADVLKYVMEDGSWFALRPSGTEPKLKFYFYTRDASRGIAGAKVSDLSRAVLDLAESVK